MRHLSQVTVIINEISLVNSNICHMWWLSIFMTCNIDHMRYLSDLIVIVTCNFSHEIFIKCYIYHMWYLPTYYMWYSLHEIYFTSDALLITSDSYYVRYSYCTKSNQLPGQCLLFNLLLWNNKTFDANLPDMIMVQSIFKEVTGFQDF